MVEFLIENSELTQLIALLLSVLVIVLQSITISKLKKLLKEAMHALKETLHSATKLADLNDTLIKQIDDDEHIIQELLDKNKCGKNCCKNKKPKK